MDMQELHDYDVKNTSLQKSETGEILSYKIGHNYSFPCVILYNKNNEFKKYKLDVLKGMIRKDGMMVYLHSPKGDIKVGYIDTNGLKVLKDSEVFVDYDILVYLDETTEISGDMIYALM